MSSKSRACLFDNFTGIFQASNTKNAFWYYKCSFSKYVGKSHFLIGNLSYFFFIFNGEKWAWPIAELFLVSDALVVYFLFHLFRSDYNFGYFASNCHFSTRSCCQNLAFFWNFSTLSWQYSGKQNYHHCWLVII